MEDDSCQIFTNSGLVLLRVDCPLHFPIECQLKVEVMRTYLEVKTKLKKN
ncbi:hypothetical protein BHE74_00014261 [Ensete ventricosum]|nr:hypothetical protein GW17_00030618 [Ensete ventricosum]RWW77572.1 hypothetical protein BHE74_00014261 [Ensete ventricosum]RZR98883.1 hypothetical protein BHM03_00028328 [Ensete ventricosum]